ncbi:MAG: SUMF1/EgtB/PvdO family nonheme iron enzyme [Planctomycetota bacterium]
MPGANEGSEGSTQASGSIPPGSQIGLYRVLDRLGEGGMGAVYRAEQLEPVKRRVALKVIKLGMDSKAVVARFEQERQALAMMDHEGIAKVYDCGTTDRGQPFFAMELVKGVPLDQFCEQQKLSLKDRLLLMRQVCAAVQHAHQKGVVHRDLKPGNVLVTDDGGKRQVKIIDFGLAKAMAQRLVENSYFTEAGVVLGTPEYMAPEQADPTNQDVDTRADVYSLGVMLYQVLCGDLPFPGPELRAAGMMELQRILREVEPPKPSTRITKLGAGAAPLAETRRVSLSALKKALVGDLDWVVLKALEKERNRRYETANALSADLQRFLDNEPLVAGPPSAGYRLKKLVRRYRVQVIAGGLVLFALIGGGIGTFVQYLRAEEQRAQARTNEARALRNEQLAKERAEENAALAQQKTELAAAETKAKEDALAQKRRADEAAAANEKLAKSESAAKAEAERTVSNFHQLSAVVRLKDVLARQAGLWPAWPDKIEQLKTWLEKDCAGLLAQRPQIQATLAELRSKALPRSPEQLAEEQRQSPDWPEYEQQLEATNALRRAQGIRSGKNRFVPVELPAGVEGGSLKEMHDAVWNAVRPDRERPTGEGALALVLAEFLLAKVRGTDAESNVLDTVAWAQFANGLDDAARASAAAAVAKATDEERAGFSKSQQALEEAIAAAPARLAEAEQALLDLEAKVSERRTWTFGTDEESESARFLHDALVGVLAGLESMAAKEKRDVEQRLSWAQQVRGATFGHPEARVTWAAVREALLKADDVVASKQYAGLSIPLADEAVIGLVPIGMNPVTKLWEFYDLRSAWDGKQAAAEIEIPTHKEDGSIEVKAGTGIVFVLLPGGTVTLGSQKDDPNAPFYDPQHQDDETLHEVTLSPFFLARHELTRGQWQRLAGDQPTGWEDGSRYDGDRIAIGRTHPADSMDWDTGDRWMTRHGMALPTEAQWEYGARGGTTTVFWPGQTAADLQGFANVHDKTSFERFPQWGEPAPITDGFRALAPVASFRPNGFGLFDVHGNVWEWCRDWYGDYGRERVGDGLRSVSSPASRTFRGGSYSDAAVLARSAYRILYAPSFRDDNLGLRPARLITY